MFSFERATSELQILWQPYFFRMYMRRRQTPRKKFLQFDQRATSSFSLLLISIIPENDEKHFQR